VRGLTADSRRCEAGDCFVAGPGFKQDARASFPTRSRGAPRSSSPRASRWPASRSAQVLVPAARRAMARLAGAYHGNPSRALTLVGITGTNGKTTRRTWSTRCCARAALRTGILGTSSTCSGRGAAGEPDDAGGIEIQSMLAEMRERGIGGVAMEVSSHALALSRVDGLAF
jgi:UDP-N-acetylmuramoyl-L-alanyl-D-glutamate--2,6-diaminopimelate ligase